MQIILSASEPASAGRVSVCPLALWAQYLPRHSGLNAPLFQGCCDLLSKLTRHPLSAQDDPLRELRAWPETARVVSDVRSKLLGAGRPVFIMAKDEGLACLLAFYLPRAKGEKSDQIVVYPALQVSNPPVGSPFVWPNDQSRLGANAVFVQETELPQPPPDSVRQAFATITDLGLRDIFCQNRIYRRIQLFECHDLR